LSGKPYPEGVTEIVAALARCEELRETIDKLEPMVEKLKDARAEYQELSEKISKKLDAMDLQAQGNFGFGGRMGWFLAEMRRQIVAAVRRGG